MRGNRFLAVLILCLAPLPACNNHGDSTREPEAAIRGARTELTFSDSSTRLPGQVTVKNNEKNLIGESSVRAKASPSACALALYDAARQAQVDARIRDAQIVTLKDQDPDWTVTLYLVCPALVRSFNSQNQQIELTPGTVIVRPPPEESPTGF